MRIAALQETDESRLLHVLRKMRVRKWVAVAVADTRELKSQVDLEFSFL